ncbi:MAG: hypothetical protein PHC66_01975 [Candidatus Nanoarchaeia archaeon]|nr:hypothetical protein [Candidatus Nanoarchaeia archaeon]MDD5239056.1 hypothetical protein [Candidatus Nanoarchaeia archaeon]
MDELIKILDKVGICQCDNLDKEQKAVAKAVSLYLNNKPCLYSDVLACALRFIEHRGQKVATCERYAFHLEDVSSQPSNPCFEQEGVYSSSLQDMLDKIVNERDAPECADFDYTIRSKEPVKKPGADGYLDKIKPITAASMFFYKDRIQFYKYLKKCLKNPAKITYQVDLEMAGPLVQNR